MGLRQRAYSQPEATFLVGAAAKGSPRPSMARFKMVNIVSAPRSCTAGKLMALGNGMRAMGYIWVKRKATKMAQPSRVISR